MAETNSNKTVTLNEKFARSDLWFHPGEELAEGEMRVTLMGTGWGSMIRPNQKHWPALHIIDGAISYCIEWNGYKVVWSGDTQPNYYITEYGKKADLFIHETAPTPTRFAQASDLPEATCQNIVEQAHTPALALGKILSIAKPTLAVTCHCPIDPEEWEKFISGVRTRWDGQYQIGEDLMVFTLSKNNTTPTVRKGDIYERPWNVALQSNPDTSPIQYTVNPDKYRTPEIFNDSPSGHHIPDSEWKPSNSDSD